jgi:hypothetical protein
VNAPLPPGWEEYLDEQGDAAFRNAKLKKDQTEHPLDPYFSELVIRQRTGVAVPRVPGAPKPREPTPPAKPPTPPAAPSAPEPPGSFHRPPINIYQSSPRHEEWVTHARLDFRSSSPAGRIGLRLNDALRNRLLFRLALPPLRRVCHVRFVSLLVRAC